MVFKEIYIKDLKDFVQSDLYKQFSTVPISEARAKSQIRNPRAVPDDLALFIALTENNQIAGFVGALPEWLLGNSENKIYWNSCWWVHPQLGKGLAVPLLFRFLKLLKHRVFFNDLPATSVAVLEKTGFYSILPAIEGERLFLRFCFEKIVRSKYPKMAISWPFFWLLDGSLNICLASLRKVNLWFQRISTDYSFEEVIGFDAEVDKLIKNKGNNPFNRTSAEFQWIHNNSWLITSKEHETVKYPFSLKTESFRNHLYKMKYNGEMHAFIWLSERNGNVRIPYLYCTSEHYNELSKFLCLKINLLKTNELIFFNSQLSFTLKSGFPFYWYKKKIVRYAAYPKEYEYFNLENYYWQSGDGDAIFT